MTLDQIFSSYNSYKPRTDGAVRALQLYGFSDITNGAWFWEGTAPYKNSKNYFRKKSGGSTIFVITKTIGETHYLKYNPDNKNYGKSIWP